MRGTMRRCIAAIRLLVIGVWVMAGEGVKGPAPLVRAHSHNDYQHERPCLDALDCGFCSIEADIYLVEGKLLVGHDPRDLKAERTLQKLYLEPLRERVAANGGRVYRDGPGVTLLIDIKTEAEGAYGSLRGVLKEYAGMLTVFRADKTEAGAVTVIVSGNRPRKTMAAEAVRYAGCDGRLEDLDTADSAHLIPLISSNWVLTFKWRGVGEFPQEEKETLKELVAKAHKAGRRIRFWSAPDDAAGWSELLAAEVDLVNTDHLGELRDFLLKRANATNK